MCGPDGGGDCCSSPLVPGGTFDRSNDAAAPATIHDFRLDAYEVTVGRFRNFVAAYTQTMTPEGAGKNPNIPADPGWSKANYDNYLPRDAMALMGDVAACFDSAWTNSVGSNEALPINCVNWFEAAAFCAWDGGRLPTEAEWNYAAAGGTDQRLYPWGSNPPANDKALANYCFSNDAEQDCRGAQRLTAVGSIPAGNGRWGQADLAGNVDEWLEDWYVAAYAPCPTDCISLTPTSGVRVLRGGSYFEPASTLMTVFRTEDLPSNGDDTEGFRCARAP
jgi:formylglycine-generating enzyme required for sulfatase activity